jgi:hypothetical protein
VGFLRSRSKGSVGARAQLTSFQDSKFFKASVNPGDAGKSLHSICLLRVAPENGQPEFQSQMSVWGKDADRLRAGRWTYVLYDPDKPYSCDLDTDRLAKEFGPDHQVMVPRDVSDAWGLDRCTTRRPSGRRWPGIPQLSSSTFRSRWRRVAAQRPVELN